jgi:WD40 repeat protein
MARFRPLFLLWIVSTLFLAACQTPTPTPGTPVQVTVWKDTVGAITAMEMHPNGRLLATGTDSGAIRVWDVVTGQIVTSYNAHNKVTSLAYNREGTYLATGGADGALRLWDTADSRLLVQPPLFFGNIGAISWLKDSTQRLFLSTDDQVVHLVDMNARGVIVKEFKGHSTTITGASYVGGTRYLATSSTDRNLIIWDILSGGVLAALTQDTPVMAMRPSPNGRFVAIGMASGLVRVLRVQDTIGKSDVSFGTKSAVFKVAWNADGTRIAVSFADKTVRVYDPATGLQVAVLVGHTADPISLIWRDKDRVMSADREGFIRTWEVGALQPPAGTPTATPTPGG